MRIRHRRGKKESLFQLHDFADISEVYQILIMITFSSTYNLISSDIIIYDYLNIFVKYLFILVVDHHQQLLFRRSWTFRFFEFIKILYPHYSRQRLRCS